MKKFYTIALIIFTFSALQAQINFAPKIGVNFPASQNFSMEMFDVDEDAALGFELGAEITTSIIPMIEIGGGFAYQLPRDLDVEDGGQFNFLPVYAMGQVNFIDLGVAKIGGVVNVGYNVAFMGDDTYKAGADLAGGLYWGIGARGEFSKIFVEAMYKAYTGTYENSIEELGIEDFKADIQYNTFTISAGIKF